MAIIKNHSFVYFISFFAFIGVVFVGIYYFYTDTTEDININDDITIGVESTSDNSLQTNNYNQQYIDNLITNYNFTSQYKNTNYIKEGISLANTLNVRSQPSTEWDSEIIMTIEKDEMFEISEEKPRWYKVNYNGVSGWVNKEYVQIVSTILAKHKQSLILNNIQLTMLNDNTLNIQMNSPSKLDLTSQNNGVFIVESDNLLFNNSTPSEFDINFENIPVLRATDNKIELFTHGWSKANLVKLSDTLYQLHFIQLVKDIEYTADSERDIYILKTSGAPKYSFEYTGKQLKLFFTEEVLFENLETADNDPYLNRNFVSNIEINNSLDSSLDSSIRESFIQFDAKENVTWKVVEQPNQIIIDISDASIKNKRIIIDPGHGGSEVGTYGRQTDILEKDFTLSLAKYIEAELKNYGAVTYLTRTDDSNVYPVNESTEVYETYYDLNARVEFAKQNDADIFISIHADNFPADRSVSGTTGFYYDKAPQINQSKELAYLISSEVSQSIKTRWLGIKEDSFVVIKNNPYPSVLIEYGFLSNRDDEYKLTNLNSQQVIAKATANAIKKYFSEGAN